MGNPAPVGDVTRYLLVRSPRAEASTEASKLAIRITPSQETKQALASADPALNTARISELQKHLEKPVHKQAAQELEEFREKFDALDTQSGIKVDVLQSLLGGISDTEKVAELQAIAGDLYLLSGISSPGDLPALAKILQNLWLYNALQETPESDVLSPDDLSRPMFLVEREDVLREKAVAPEIQDNNNPATDFFRKLVYLRVADNLLRELRQKNELKVEADPPPAAPAAMVAAGDEDEKLISRHQSADASVVATIDWSKRLPASVADYLKTQYAIDDLNLADIIRLTERVSVDLRDHVTTALGGVQTGRIVAFSRALDRVAQEYSQKVIENLDSFLQLSSYSPLQISKSSGQVPGGKGIIQPTGVGDLKVVRQQLQRYALGEIAYIENVLTGEVRARNHVRSERVEQQYTYEEEETASSEKDLQTTERFELSQEIDRQQSESRKTDAGINVSASYGAVTMAAHAGLSTEGSVQEAERNARKYTRETISKAAEKLQKRVRKQQTITTTFELKEENQHSFTAKDKDAVGIYRWVEKEYWCQTFNYGARVMFEVMVPEPAAFYAYAVDNKPRGEAQFKAPEEPNFTAKDIDESNYFALAARYGAAVSAPSPAYRLSQVMALQGAGDTDSNAGKFTIDEDYEMVMAAPVASCRIVGNGRASYTVLISPHLWDSSVGSWGPGSFYPGVRGEAQVAFNGVYVEHYAVSIKLLLSRTSDALDRWKMTTFNAIQEAYVALKSDYERKLAALQARRGAPVTARTEAEYRSIEKAELKRSSLQLLTGQDFSLFDAVKRPANAAPLMDPTEAVIEGQYANFFESAFEWDEIVYEFLPYFWGNKDTWLEKLGFSDMDPIFAKFLRAGFAKVLVPVRRGRERVLLYYLETGTLWQGDGAPVVTDKFYLSLLSEVEARDSDEGQTTGIAEGSPWKQTVPTNLVCLETRDLKLPSWEIDTGTATGEFLPSKELCNGIPYNAAQWTDDRKTVVQALKTLGYQVVVDNNALAYLGSLDGKRVVRAFQMNANDAGIPALIGRPLGIDGVLGPCSLRALTAAVAMNAAGKWPKPA
ncbi:hypothetical protein KX729_22230 [Rhizobium sp. XQZ8]|uniref:hypothetical protein n=1 Tax=Rhizobium populisoli TaxID=2859785 RepID=UPI001CA57077|nr:hypothetical protein [Rhizobium populisoli]MBW6424185.1 hypothetical protein [Rhizobium populisoli]